MLHPVLVQFLVKLCSIRLFRSSFKMLKLVLGWLGKFSFLSELPSQFFGDRFADPLNQISIDFHAHCFAPLWFLLDVLAF